MRRFTRFFQPSLILLTLGFSFPVSSFAQSHGHGHRPRPRPRVTPISIVQKIISFYPEETPAAVRTRITETSSALEFLRSFVPYYYDLLKTNAPLTAPISSLLPFTGLCAGDAHPMNFGTTLARDGSPLFSINDPDDAGNCPVILDSLRFFVALNLMNLRGTSNDLIFGAYEAGIADLPSPSAPALLKWIKKNSSKGTRIPGKYLAADGLSLDRSSSDTSEIEADTRNLLDEAYLKTVPLGVSVLDAIQYVKPKGGSGDMQRYWILSEDPIRPETLSLSEWKQMGTPGVFFYSHSLTAIVPLPSVLNWELGSAVRPEFHAVLFEGKTYFSRPKWKATASINPKDFSPADFNDVVMVEAWVLGQLHRTSLGGQAGAYLSALQKKLNSNSLSSIVSNITSQVNKDFQTSRSAITMNP